MKVSKVCYRYSSEMECMLRSCSNPMSLEIQILQHWQGKPSVLSSRIVFKVGPP